MWDLGGDLEMDGDPARIRFPAFVTCHQLDVRTSSLLSMSAFKFQVRLYLQVTEYHGLPDLQFSVSPE